MQLVQDQGSQAAFPLEGLKLHCDPDRAAALVGSQAVYPLEGLKQVIPGLVRHLPFQGCLAAFPLEGLKH